MKAKETTWSHKELVSIGYRWILKHCSCGVAFREFNTNASNGEYPDVIGFGAWGHSVLMEVKISRSDFFADRKKMFRKYPEMGMGTQRFYCCPSGLIKKEDLPEAWGLVWVNERGRATMVHSPYHGNIGERHQGFKKNMLAEHGLMYSALRRLHIRGRIDEVYEPKPDLTMKNKTEENETSENETGVEVRSESEVYNRH